MRHAIRDQYGRFTPKTSRTSTSKMRPVKTKAKKSIKESYDLFIIDRSGSMSNVIQETLNGFNEAVDNIKTISQKEGINSYVSFVQFDDNIELLYLNREVSKVAKLTPSTFVPRGMTALYDAIATGIEALKGSVSDKKNASVTVYIFTDGAENSSRHYNKGSINKLISDVRDNLKWTITFIGAGSLDTVQTAAQSIGIFMNNTLNYTAGKSGTSKAFTKMSNSRGSSLTQYSTTGTVTNDGFFSND